MNWDHALSGLFESRRERNKIADPRSGCRCMSSMASLGYTLSSHEHHYLIFVITESDTVFDSVIAFIGV
jgi:hypothetical protein